MNITVLFCKLFAPEIFPKNNTSLPQLFTKYPCASSVLFLRCRLSFDGWTTENSGYYLARKPSQGAEKHLVQSGIHRYYLAMFLSTRNNTMSNFCDIFWSPASRRSISLSHSKLRSDHELPSFHPSRRGDLLLQKPRLNRIESENVVKITKLCELCFLKLKIVWGLCVREQNVANGVAVEQ